MTTGQILDPLSRAPWLSSLPLGSAYADRYLSPLLRPIAYLRKPVRDIVWIGSRNSCKLCNRHESSVIEQFIYCNDLWWFERLKRKEEDLRSPLFEVIYAGIEDGESLRRKENRLLDIVIKSARKVLNGKFCALKFSNFIWIDDNQKSNLLLARANSQQLLTEDRVILETEISKEKKEKERVWKKYKQQRKSVEFQISSSKKETTWIWAITAGGNFCNGGTMVNGCWSTHSSLAQTHSPANPAREIPYVFLRPKRIPRAGIDIQTVILGYVPTDFHKSQPDDKRALESCVTSDRVGDRCRGTQSRGDRMAPPWKIPPRVSFDTLDYQTFLWSSPSMLVTTNLRSPPRFHGFDKGSGYFSFSQLPREMCSVCLGSKIR